MKHQVDYASLSAKAYADRRKLLESSKTELQSVLVSQTARESARIQASRELREIDAELICAAVARAGRKTDRSRALARELEKRTLELEDARARIAELEAAATAQASRHDSA